MTAETETGSPSSGTAARLARFYAAIFLVSGIQLPFWPVWLAGRGLDAKQIGLVLAAAIWAKVIATPALGALADRPGRHRRVMAALAGTAFLAYGALWPAVGFWPLLLINLVAATAQSALLPLGDSITLGAIRSRQVEYGRVRLWGSLSFILASFGSGLLLASGSRFAMPSDRVLALVIAASVLLLLACLGMPRRLAVDRSRLGGLRRLVADRRFWMFVVAGSTLQASHQVYYGFGSLYWHRLGLSDGVIGALWAEGVIAEIVMFWKGRWLHARLGPLGLMALGGAAGVVRWSLSGFVTWLPGIMALQLLHAGTFGATHLGAMHYMARTVPPSAAASAQTLYTSLSASLGSGLVMLGAGALYAAYGGRAYLFMAVLSAAGIIATGGLARLSRR